MWPWPLILTFKLVRARDKYVLSVNLDLIRSAVPKIFFSYRDKKSHRQRQKQNLTQFTECGNEPTTSVQNDDYRHCAGTARVMETTVRRGRCSDVLWRLVERMSRWCREVDCSTYERQQPEMSGHRRWKGACDGAKSLMMTQLIVDVKGRYTLPVFTGHEHGREHGCHFGHPSSKQKKTTIECGQMPNVMVALPNTGGALCSTPQSLADAHYWSAVQ